MDLLSKQNRSHSVLHSGERFQAIARTFAKSPEGTLVVSPDNNSRQETRSGTRAAAKLSGWRRRHTPPSFTSTASVNEITVKKANGANVTYDPARVKGVAIYEPEKRVFAEGDRIQFTAPWKEKAVSGRDLGTIKHLDESGNIAVTLDGSGRTVAWNLNQNKHVDYAYAMTSHSSQGATVDRALIHIDTGDSRVRTLIDETLAYVEPPDRATMRRFSRATPTGSRLHSPAGTRTRPLYLSSKSLCIPFRCNRYVP